MTGWDRAYGATAEAVCAALDPLARACGATRAEIAQRRGFLPPARAPLLWFHGASAGEMTAAAVLVRLLRGRGRAFVAGLSAANRAGVDAARRSGLDDALVAFAPWDAPRRVVRAFDAWRPEALFLVETELWPRLVFEAARRAVPVFVVSARLYPRDVGRYRAIRRFLAPTWQRLTAVLAQDETERARFVEIGVPPEKCAVAGNLKHAAVAPAPRRWKPRCSACLR